jgi:hypothetical protein
VEIESVIGSAAEPELLAAEFADELMEWGNAVLLLAR